jgi:hypothetical protein
MGWIGFKIILRLRSPLHVGAGQVGNVQRARPYVGGRALWGALTARLTRDCPELGGDYVAVGCRVNEELAFTYLYPASGEQVQPWPWGEGSDEFAWRYLHSYASTALDYGSRAAQEGSLHEVEFIAPYTRCGRPVSLVGYIFEREGATLPWRQALARLQLGGERGYGWGRVALAAEPAREEIIFGHYALEAGGERPVLRAEGGDQVPLLAHTLACDQGHAGAVAARGTIEPLVGRETKEAGRFGGVPSPALICWAPGATVAKETRLAVAPYGVWVAG